jgi:hypothetical protein
MSPVNDNGRKLNIAAEVDVLKQDVSEIKALIKEMHILLSGNPLDKKSAGLIGEVRQNSDDLQYLRGVIKKYKSYFYALMTLVGAGAFKFVIDFFDK